MSLFSVASRCSSGRELYYWSISSGCARRLGPGAELNSWNGTLLDAEGFPNLAAEPVLPELLVCRCDEGVLGAGRGRGHLLAGLEDREVARGRLPTKGANRHDPRTWKGVLTLWVSKRVGDGTLIYVEAPGFPATDEFRGVRAGIPLRSSSPTLHGCGRAIRRRRRLLRRPVA